MNGFDKEQVETSGSRWVTPDFGEVKLNFDGGLTEERARCGFDIRHESGVIMVAGCLVELDRSVIVIMADSGWVENCKTKVSSQSSMD